MNSLESVNAKLQMAVTALDQATHEIDDLELEPMHLRDLRAALGNILHVQQELCRPPNLDSDPAPMATASDVGFTPVEAELVANLSAAELAEIDAVLLSYAKRSWRKAAMLVALTMAQDIHQEGMPSAFYAQRIQRLVDQGHLEAQGAEVRLPDGNSRPPR